MNAETVIAEVETHPILLIIAAVGLFAIGYSITKAKNPAPVASSTAVQPAVHELYNQTYNTYPTAPPVSAPPVVPPVTPPVVPPGKPPIQPPVVKPPQPVLARYVTVGTWPAQNSTLWGIAGENGISLATIEKLNPQYSGNWNLIHPGDRVRIK